MKTAAKLYAEYWAPVQDEFAARKKAMLAAVADKIEAQYPRAVDLLRTLQTGEPGDLLNW